MSKTIVCEEEFKFEPPPPETKNENTAPKTLGEGQYALLCKIKQCRECEKIERDICARKRREYDSAKRLISEYKNRRDTLKKKIQAKKYAAFAAIISPVMLGLFAASYKTLDVLAIIFCALSLGILLLSVIYFAKYAAYKEEAKKCREMIGKYHAEKQRLEKEIEICIEKTNYYISKYDKLCEKYKDFFDF